MISSNPSPQLLSPQQKRLLASTPAGLAVLHSEGRWTPARHLLILNEVLVMAMTGRVKRLVLNMPPRHGKSELFSKYLPPCFLGNYPDKRVILASYEAEFASSWGGKGKQIMTDVGEDLYGVRIGKRMDNNWTTMRRDHATGVWRPAGGGMSTAGAGGPITGKGADLFLIDDPIKNDAEARSETHRAHQWDWFISTAMTRLEPKGVMVILMTRWHEDDLTGRVRAMAKEIGEEWTFLNFPAICEDDTHPLEQRLGRKNGQALWPERYNEEALALTKSRSVFWWNGLYQQRPAPAEGHLVKSAWIRTFSIVEHGQEKLVELHTPQGTRRVRWADLRIFFTVDLAASTKTQADYTVVSVWGLVPETQELLWIDAEAEQMEGPDQEKLILRMYSLWQPVAVGVEATAYQLTMVQKLVNDGLPAYKLKADKDKVSRFIPMATHYSNGKVYHRHLAPFLVEAEPQLLQFPNAKNDDYVDTGSYAYKMMQMFSGVAEIGIDGA